MKHQLKMLNLVRSVYTHAVDFEGGFIGVLNVVGISIPERMQDDFHEIDDYSLNAINHVEKFFPNADIEFTDIDKITLKYNVVKTF